MAMTLAGPAGASRGRTIASINVTPMADIMIVLLIIFMVITPLVGQEARGRLPSVAHAASEDEARRALVVVIEQDGAVRLGAERVLSEEDLSRKIEEPLAARSVGNRIVLLKADEGLPYARVRSVMDACRAAGAEGVALIAAPGLRRSGRP